MLIKSSFDIDACLLAKFLIGKVIFRRIGNVWRKARIIETEAYYKNEKGSHASLGYTYKRRALFEKTGGTIYMYHSQGGASFNISANGEGNAVLIKSAVAHLDNSAHILAEMGADNPIKSRNGVRSRPYENLCSGQALLCRSLRLSINEWDARDFSADDFYIGDSGYTPTCIAVTRRLGIPDGRDEHLPFRFVDFDFIKYATKSQHPVIEIIHP